MSIGLVNDSEFELELTRLSGVKSNDVVPSSDSTDGSKLAEVLDIPSRGRKNGDVNVPDSLRQIIGETSVIEGRQAGIDLAASFGISPSSVSAYAKGSTSTTTYNEPSKSILTHINKSRQRHIKRASKVLNLALSSISQEKLDYTDARDLSGIAKDMSVIIKNLEPPQQTDSIGPNQGPQFTIYAPQFRQENSFEIVKVNE